MEADEETVASIKIKSHYRFEVDLSIDLSGEVDSSLITVPKKAYLIRNMIDSCLPRSIIRQDWFSATNVATSEKGNKYKDMNLSYVSPISNFTNLGEFWKGSVGSILFITQSDRLDRKHETSKPEAEITKIARSFAFSESIPWVFNIRIACSIHICRAEQEVPAYPDTSVRWKGLSIKDIKKPEYLKMARNEMLSELIQISKLLGEVSE